MDNVKSYLNEIELNEEKLEIIRNELEKYKSIATSITPSREEKVQSSLKGDKMTDNVARYIEKEKQHCISSAVF